MTAAEEMLQRILDKKAGKQPVQTQVQTEVQPVDPNQAIISRQAVNQPQSEAELMLERIQQMKSEAPPMQPETPQPTTFQSAADIVTGRLRETEQTKTLPEFMSSPDANSGDFLQNLKMTAGMMFIPGDEAKKDILRKNFPGIEIEPDEKGNEIITLPNGKQMLLNDPGLSYQDMLEFLGDASTFFIPGAKVAGMTGGAIKKGLVGGAAMGATQAGLEASGQLIGSEQGIDPVNVMSATGMGLGGEAVSAYLKNRKLVKQAEKLGLAKTEKELYQESLKKAKQAKKVSEKSGVRIFRPQATESFSDMQTAAYIGSLPEASQKAMKELKAQNKEVYSGLINVMDSIAPAEAVEAATGKIRNVAQQAIELKKAIRREKASPLYKEAFKDKKFVSTKETKNLINEKLKDLPEKGEVYKSLKKIKNYITPKTVDGKPVTRGLRLKQLHNAKLEIDQMISKFGENSLGNTTKKEVLEIQQSLLKEMDKANPSYKEAREIFAKNSPAVAEIKESMLGKMSKLDDAQLDSVVTKLFKPNTNPVALRKAISVIKKQDPKAWGAIKRHHFETLLGKMKISEEMAQDTVRNVPAQILSKVFGNQSQRKVLYEGLEPQTTRTLRYLESAAQMASKARPGGSQTGFNVALDKKLRGGLWGSIMGVFADPVKAVGGAGAMATGTKTLSDYAYTNRVKALGDVLFNPEWAEELKAMRKLDPNSKAAGNKFRTMLNSAIKNYPKKGALKTGELIKPAAQAIIPEED